MNPIDLVALNQLEPAVYNPRETDPFRLRLLQLSLRKLGFILPLYATPEGHLLSGHQRLLASELMGAVTVPVVRAAVNMANIKNVNLIFNRTTNDMRTNDTSDNLLASLDLNQIEAMAAAVPDKMPNSPEFYRCTQAELRPLAEITRFDMAKYEDGAVAMAGKLMRLGLFMPAVVTDTGRVINGSYRIYAAADAQAEWGSKRYHFDRIIPAGHYPVLTIPDAEGDLALALLNMISMRFTLEKQYAQNLRYGSFRRPQNIVEDILPCMRIWVDRGVRKAAHKSLKEPEKFWNAFRREHGESVLDFGAGQRRQEELLRQKSIETVSWEPYPCLQEKDKAAFPECDQPGRPYLPLAHHLTDTLLDKVASGTSFSTIVLNAVLNSVPFEMDRRYVLLIVNSLCSFGTRVVGSVRHVRVQENADKRQKARMTVDGRKSVALAMFPLDYEPHLSLGDISVMPKVQRFHTPEEIDKLLKLFFMKTEVIDGGNYIYFRATAPRRTDPKLLKKALTHEFNLPYEGTATLNRHQEALAAFGQRLGINFDEVPDV